MQLLFYILIDINIFPLLEIISMLMRPAVSIVLKTKPVWWFNQKKPEPKPSPVF
jgi:hypothetical protein